MSLKERFGIAHSHDLGWPHVIVQEDEQLVDDVADAEKYNRVLIAAAFKMRLRVSYASYVASGGTNFFQFAIRSIEPEFPLQHEGNVGDLVLMNFHLRVGIELEDGVNDPVLPVGVVDLK